MRLGSQSESEGLLLNLTPDHKVHVGSDPDPDPELLSMGRETPCAMMTISSLTGPPTDPPDAPGMGGIEYPSPYATTSRKKRLYWLCF